MVSEAAKTALMYDFGVKVSAAHGNANAQDNAIKQAVRVIAGILYRRIIEKRSIPP